MAEQGIATSCLGLQVILEVFGGRLMAHGMETDLLRKHLVLRIICLSSLVHLNQFQNIKFPKL